MKKQAESIVRDSSLSEEQKALWYGVIDANDPSFAEQFVGTVGEDAETLSIATELLQVRKDAETPLEPGFISPAEQQYLHNLMDNTPKN